MTNSIRHDGPASLLASGEARNTPRTLMGKVIKRCAGSMAWLEAEWSEGKMREAGRPVRVGRGIQGVCPKSRTGQESERP